jgi:hypothetical protein
VDVTFFRKLGAFKKLSTFEKWSAHRVIRRKFLSSTCLMEKVQNSAIQMSFYQVGITFVARFIGREWFACDLTEKAEALECRFHK